MNSPNVWCSEIVTHCPWVLGSKMAIKENKRKVTYTLSLSLTHTCTHQKEIDSVLFLQSFLVQIAWQLYNVVLKPKNRECRQLVDVPFKITFDNSCTNQVNKIWIDFEKKIASLWHPVLRNEMTCELFFLVISLLNPSLTQTIYLC